MTTDWIKVRTDLYRHPKIITIADFLFDDDGKLAWSVKDPYLGHELCVTRNVLRNATVGALVTLWGTLRHRAKRNGDDAILELACQFTIDQICDLPGLGNGLIEVGWAIETETGVIFPRFFKDLNVDPIEEKKSKNADRQKRYRERHGGVTETSKSNAREEKRREEKNRDLNTNTNNIALDKSDEGQEAARSRIANRMLPPPPLIDGISSGATNDGRGEVTASSRVPPKDKGSEIAPGVFLNSDQRSSIIKNIPSKAERAYWTAELADYAATNPVKWRRYKNHERVMVKWRRRHLENGFTWAEALGRYEKKPHWSPSRPSEARVVAPTPWKPPEIDETPADPEILEEARVRVRELTGGLVKEIK